MQLHCNANPTNQMPKNRMNPLATRWLHISEKKKSSQQQPFPVSHHPKGVFPGKIGTAIRIIYHFSSATPPPPPRRVLLRAKRSFIKFLFRATLPFRQAQGDEKKVLIFEKREKSRIIIIYKKNTRVAYTDTNLDPPLFVELIIFLVGFFCMLLGVL